MNMAGMDIQDTLSVLIDAMTDARKVLVRDMERDIAPEGHAQVAVLIADILHVENKIEAWLVAYQKEPRNP